MGSEAINQIAFLIAESDEGGGAAALIQLVILLALAVGAVALFRLVKRLAKRGVEEDEGLPPPTP